MKNLLYDTIISMKVDSIVQFKMMIKVLSIEVKIFLIAEKSLNIKTKKW